MYIYIYIYRKQLENTYHDQFLKRQYHSKLNKKGEGKSI